jgi:transcriptional regulator with XRE-family HTH domain
MYERGILAARGSHEHPSMTRTNGRAFNEWLRAQLKAKKMSQRQLAQQSGVDHSTISRLVRGDRMPSLGTATKLARGLRELGENDEGPQYLGLMGGGVQNPTARVEYALRADEALSEAQVRQVMEYYLAVRMRRMGSTFSHDSGTGSYGRGDNGRPNGPHLPATVGPNGLNGANSLGGQNGLRGPIVPRPSLVSGGGRATATADSRLTSSPRLRQVRSQEGV